MSSSSQGGDDIQYGAALVFLNVSIGTEFGIDVNVYRVGEKFRGVKMIPPGLHFIYYSAVNKQDQAAPRTGFFHFFAPNELLVKKWDPKNEDICDDSAITDEEKERLRLNLKGDLDRFLAPYPQTEWRKWVGLTNHISEPLLHRLEPQQGKILSATQYVRKEPGMEGTSSESNKSDEDKLLPDMVAIPGTENRYTDIPKRRFPEGANPSEITKHSMDSSYVLETMLKSYDKPEDILGEIQMAFVCFMFGHVYDSFEQWKKLVHLLCTSDAALTNHTKLYSSFISVMHFQLKEIPSDFFVDIVENVNFLTATFQIFFSNVADSSVDDELKARTKKFKRTLTKALRWDFDSEPPDEAPVVVELP